MARKVITIAEQLEEMNKRYGIPTDDALNVLSSYDKTLKDMIGVESDAGTKEFALETQFGEYAFKWTDAEQRINSTDGVEYTAPARYIADFAFPKAYIDTANRNVDFSGVPSASDIAKSRAA